jgi:hypothetical protein
MGFLDGLANSVGKSVSKGIEDFDLGKLFNNAVGNNAQPVNPVVQFTPPATIISPQAIKKDYTAWYVAGGFGLLLVVLAFVLLKK